VPQNTHQFSLSSSISLAYSCKVCTYQILKLGDQENWNFQAVFCKQRIFKCAKCDWLKTKLSHLRKKYLFDALKSQEVFRFTEVQKIFGSFMLSFVWKNVFESKKTWKTWKTKNFFLTKFKNCHIRGREALTFIRICGLWLDYGV
jgi:hypothetical protein